MVKRKSLPTKSTEGTSQPLTSVAASRRTNDSSSDQQKPTEPSTSATSKRKPRSGTRVLREIKRLQTSTNLLIPKAPFFRLIKELIHDRAGSGMRITEMALEALREASECALISIFEDSYLLALHSKRVTLFPRDMALLLRLRNDAFLTPN
jgi:histone H3/H4